MEEAAQRMVLPREETGVVGRKCDGRSSVVMHSVVAPVEVWGLGLELVDSVVADWEELLVAGEDTGRHAVE